MAFPISMFYMKVKYMISYEVPRPDTCSEISQMPGNKNISSSSQLPDSNEIKSMSLKRRKAETRDA